MDIKKILLRAIIILALILRFYDLNWDQNNHLHPDEREIILVTLKIHLPETPLEWNQVATPDSSLNPNFFAYGSFPIYLLFFSSQLIHKTSYNDLAIVGRSLSAFFDLGTLIIIFFIGKKIIDQKLGLFAAFLYCLATFPIQAAHFYAVDTMLTFFISLELLLVLNFYHQPSIKKLLRIGFCFGIALAIKTSAIPLVIPILLSVFFTSKVSSFLTNTSSSISILKSIWFLIITGISTVLTFLIFDPFALIDHINFLKQNLEQQQMTKDAFTFPYTLQFVGNIPYWYEIKNIFLWGLGPLTSILVIIGIIIAFIQIGRDAKSGIPWSILFSYLVVYFGIVGSFAVGYMRYMLPLYPLFCLLGALALQKIWDLTKKINLTFGLSVIFTLIILIFIWPLSFMAIYTRPNTRVQATQWILNNVPPESSIAQEYWDDGIPVGGNYSYKIVPMSIYEMTDPAFNLKAYNNLKQVDYYVIASNRIHVPLTRIAQNCDNWNVPINRCPTNAAQFYQKLFAGDLGFVKVAEFTSFPTIPILNIPIDDSSADESFTVYDHPKVMIFKKVI